MYTVLQSEMLKGKQSLVDLYIDGRVRSDFVFETGRKVEESSKYSQYRLQWMAFVNSVLNTRSLKRH